MMKTIKLILAATLTAAMIAGCGCSADDNSDITPAPSTSPASDMQNNSGSGSTNAGSSGSTADTAKSGAQDIGDAASDITNGAGNAVKGAVDGVQNAVDDMTGNR